MHIVIQHNHIIFSKIINGFLTFSGREILAFAGNDAGVSHKRILRYAMGSFMNNAITFLFGACIFENRRYNISTQQMRVLNAERMKNYGKNAV